MNTIPYASSVWSMISQLWSATNFQNSTAGLNNSSLALNESSSSYSFFSSVNFEAIFDHIVILVVAIYEYLSNIAFEVYEGNLVVAADEIVAGGYRLFEYIEFTDFQLRLLREFGLILLGNIVLVCIAWKVYGPRISVKFGRPPGGSRRAIEELRISMSEFQLPKEHDFKFK